MENYIILPTYDRPELFERFIKSLISFTPPEATTGKGDNFATSDVSTKFGPESIPSLLMSV